MKFKFPIALLLVMVVLLPSVCFYPAYGSSGIASANDEPFFGVTFGGNFSEAKLLIDKVKGYTNLFVIDDWDIAMNETLLNEVCQYAVDANLYIMVYFNFIFMNASQLSANSLDLFTEAGITPFHIPWLSSVYDRWGDKFLGAYILDEPGGKQIDVGHYSGFTTVYSGRNQTTFANVSNYSDAAKRFVKGLDSRYYLALLNNASYPHSIPNATGRLIPCFTADNALYWFDYLAGYDAVFAELGWNHNEAQHIALCRGAANVQNKQWGAIITWASNDPPYLASGSQMLEELNVAYSSGAEYLIVFNYPHVNPYGALTDEHFKVLETFWNQIHSSPRNAAGKGGQVALVLPKDYGWGMRQADDKIWGLWPADDLAPQIGAKIASLIKQYGYSLDIIYDDPHFNYTEKYSTIYYWNGTTYHSSQSFFNISAPTALYSSLAIVTIVMTCIPCYLIIKNKKRRPPRVTISVPSSKAILTNLGHGELELIDNTIRFRTEKGYLRKRKEVIKEIPVTDVESIKRAGSELSLTRNGVTDTFVVEESGLVEKISEKANETLREQKRILQNKTIMQDEITKLLSVVLETVDSLFDIHRNLHEKRIDWDIIESYSKRSEQNGTSLMNQKIMSVNLDFSKIQLSVEKHLPKETSKETYDLLRALYEYFCLLSVKNELPDEMHPSYKDAKTIMLAYYTLNDIILSIIVGDKETQKEINELITLLEKLSNPTSSKVNINEIKGLINKLGAEKEKEDTIEETRMVLRQFLGNYNPSSKADA